MPPSRKLPALQLSESNFSFRIRFVVISVLSCLFVQLLALSIAVFANLVSVPARDCIIFVKAAAERSVAKQGQNWQL